MKHIVNRITALALLLILVSVIACTNEKKQKAEIKNDTVATNSNDTLLYSFRDASVPPQYHRSYTIRVTPVQVHYVIDVYGKIIGEDSLVLTRPAYDSFTTAIDKLQIKNSKEVIPEGCTGGTTDRLDLYAGSSKEVKGYIYYCGGKNYGDLEGDIPAAAALFKKLIPDLDKRIEATLNQE